METDRVTLERMDAIDAERRHIYCTKAMGVMWVELGPISHSIYAQLTFRERARHAELGGEGYV